MVANGENHRPRVLRVRLDGVVNGTQSAAQGKRGVQWKSERIKGPGAIRIAQLHGDTRALVISRAFYFRPGKIFRETMAGHRVRLAVQRVRTVAACGFRVLSER